MRTDAAHNECKYSCDENRGMKNAPVVVRRHRVACLIPVALGTAAPALTGHLGAEAISDAKAERKNDQKGNRRFHKMWPPLIV